MKKLKIIIIVYIAVFVIVTLFGLLGNQDMAMLDFAQKYFSNSEIETGRSLFIKSIVPWSIYRILAIMFLFLILKKYSSRFSEWLNLKFNSDFLITFVSFMCIFLSLAVVRLPFNINGYFTNKSFGLITSDFITWFIRFLASSGISILLTVFALSIFVQIVKKTKKYLLYIPIAFFLIGALYTIIYPRFITPLFYDTVEITDTELKSEINNLARRAGIEIEDIRVIDKSKYTSAANAYLVGFGTEKKIYLYDTLLKKFTTKEILVLLAHEICHYNEEHMLIGLVSGSIGITLIIVLLNMLSKYVYERDLKHLTRTEFHVALLLLLLFVIFISSPVKNSVSRIMEKRADDYAIELTGDPGTFIRMKTRIAKINKSYLLPHPFYVWFNHTHPPILARIKKGENK